MAAGRARDLVLVSSHRGRVLSLCCPQVLADVMACDQMGASSSGRSGPSSSSSSHGSGRHLSALSLPSSGDSHGSGRFTPHLGALSLRSGDTLNSGRYGLSLPHSPGSHTPRGPKSPNSSQHVAGEGASVIPEEESVRYAGETRKTGNR